MKRVLSIALLVLMLLITLPVPSGQAQGNRPRFRPDASLARLERERGNVHIRVDDATGTVRHLQGNLGQGRRGDEQQTARGFFAHYGDIFGLTDSKVELALDRSDRDGRGFTSVRFRQRYQGVVVAGGDVRADVDPHGSLHMIHGTLVPFPRPRSLERRINSAQATQRAQSRVGGILVGQPQLTIVRHGLVDHLVWEVLLRTAEPALWRCEIDAQTGALLDQQQTLPANKDIETYDAQASSDLPGELRRRWPNRRVDDNEINWAHENAVRVYDYYHESFGRDSLDGYGMTIISSVHYLQKYNNAFWDPSQQQAVYGDGDGSSFAPLGRSLDVVAHELTHGLTQYTAQLTYLGQSGALNEAFSDIFGALIDTSNWDIAETVFTPNVEGDALRSLADPTHYGQPSLWGEYIVLPNNVGGNNGGVHLNSGMFNHVAYVIAQKLGREKLGQIMYRTLTMKLTSTSDFIAARVLTVQACAELITPPINPRISAADCRVVEQAFIAASWGSTSRPDTGYRVYLPQLANGAAICNTDAIRNGDFEDGQHDWPNTGSVYGAVVDAWKYVRSGTQSAKIAGNTQLLQLVRRDAAQDVRLTFDVYKEKGSEDQTLIVDFEDKTTYTDLHAPIVVGANIPAGVWTTTSMTLTEDDLAPLDSFRLIFRDGSGGGTLYIDNVALQQECRGM